MLEGCQTYASHGELAQRGKQAGLAGQPGCAGHNPGNPGQKGGRGVSIPERQQPGAESGCPRRRGGYRRGGCETGPPPSCAGRGRESNGDGHGEALGHSKHTEGPGSPVKAQLCLGGGGRPRHGWEERTPLAAAGPGSPSRRVSDSGKKETRSRLLPRPQAAAADAAPRGLCFTGYKRCCSVLQGKSDSTCPPRARPGQAHISLAAGRVRQRPPWLMQVQQLPLLPAGRDSPQSVPSTAGAGSEPATYAHTACPSPTADSTQPPQGRRHFVEQNGPLRPA